MLSSEEIENLLWKQSIGRIGCHNQHEVYVVPISYAYDGENVYCHTYEGKKMDMMRANPEVCFEVDDTRDMSNWQSVVLHGKVAEINDKSERAAALKVLLARRLPILSSVTTHLGKAWPFVGDRYNDVGAIPGIIFKVCITEKSGKFEKTSFSPALPQ